MDKRLDELFKQAKEQPVISFDETKEQFLKSVTANPATTPAKVAPFFKSKIWIIMLGVSAVISIFLAVFNCGTAPEKKTEVSITPSTEEVVEVPEEPHEKLPLIELQDVSAFGIADTMKLRAKEVQVLEAFQVIKQVEEQEKVAVEPREYRLPQLTEKELTKHKKQLKLMIKELAVNRKFAKKYQFIPMQSIELRGKMNSFQAFFMQRTEVSNLEYRTFLFELLLANDRDGFIAAKPKQARWTEFADTLSQIRTESGVNPMQDMYFSHPAYDNYPVTNISKEAAEMYCVWLSKLYKENTKEPRVSEWRLPNAMEWMAAAKGGESGYQFAWCGDKLQRANGELLVNCSLIGYEDQLNTEHKSADFRIQQYVKDGRMRQSMGPQKVDSYSRNDFGLYNMCGNVAEMVSHDFDGNPGGTCGGAWINTYDEIKIESADNFKGKLDGYPTVGFRPVMTYLSTRLE